MKISGSPRLKRRSTRHISEVTTIANEFGNSAKIIVPRSCIQYLTYHWDIILSFVVMFPSLKIASSDNTLIH
ncbi:MAG: hypothetical protein WB988_11640 [Candidatus Nitrosopolaris sp.]